LHYLHQLYQCEVPDMAYTYEEFLREAEEIAIRRAIERDPEAILKRFDPEERLKGLEAEDVLKRFDPEERLKGLEAEDVLKRFDPEERLKGLDAEERLKGLDLTLIEAWLAKQRRDH